MSIMEAHEDPGVREPSLSSPIHNIIWKVHTQYIQMGILVLRAPGFDIRKFNPSKVEMTLPK